MAGRFHNHDGRLSWLSITSSATNKTNISHLSLASLDLMERQMLSGMRCGLLRISLAFVVLSLGTQSHAFESAAARGQPQRGNTCDDGSCSAAAVQPHVLHAQATTTRSPTPAVSEAATSPSALDREMAAPSFRNFPRGYFKLAAGDSVTVGGKTLQLTKDGDIRIADQNNTLLWHSDTHARCGECSLFMQGDGNLVLYANGAAIWSTGTSSNRGAFLTFSAEPPYLSIRDGEFDVTWRSSDDPGPAALLAASRVGPQAVAAKSFLDSLAVVSHVDQNSNPATDMMKMLNYLGVKIVRDGWAPRLQANYAAMAKHGVRFTFLVGDPFAANALKDLEAMAALGPGALLAVEGPNEINNWSFVTDGVTSPRGWPNEAGPLVQKFMERFYVNVHEKAKLPDTAVYNLTWGGTVDAGKYGMFDLAGQADFGNIHVYPSGQPYRTLQSAIASSYHHVLPNQAVITEVGYNTDQVSPVAQAILTLNLYLSAFQQGFNKTYVYELYDEWQKYGLFQDANRPKPAATAIHNMTTLLADTVVPAKLGKLDYVIPGLPATAHTLLLQKSGGAFYLIVWNEVPVYANGADIAVPNVPLTVNFGRKVKSANVFDPLSGLEAVQKAQGASSIAINLAGHALIIELLP